MHDRIFLLFFRYNESVLTDKDCENVYELVYSSHRQVAQAAGEFLNAKLFQKDDESLRCLKISKGKRRSPNTPLIRDLVQFFIESEVITTFHIFTFISELSLFSYISSSLTLNAQQTTPLLRPFIYL